MIWALAYVAFGLLLMSYMCPYWHPFEHLIGALIWPVSAVIGIVVMVRELRRPPDVDVEFIMLSLAILMAEDQARNRTKCKEES